MRMTTEKLEQLIQSTQPDPSRKGRLFTVEFIKKDGTLRAMRARLGLKRNLKGKGRSWEPRDRGMIGVWSADSQGYRTINLQTVQSLRLPDGSKHLREVLPPVDNFIGCA